MKKGTNTISYVYSPAGQMPCGDFLNSPWIHVHCSVYNDASYDQSNEIGQLKNGDVVEIEGTGSAGSYVYVYSPKYDRLGWVNAGFLI